jgi:short-subunit dehydrogenase
MPAIIEATKDIDIAVVFNNAGYIVTGFFDQTSLDAQLANMVRLAFSSFSSNDHRNAMPLLVSK